MERLGRSRQADLGTESALLLHSLASYLPGLSGADEKSSDP